MYILESGNDMEAGESKSKDQNIPVLLVGTETSLWLTEKIPICKLKSPNVKLSSKCLKLRMSYMLY